MFVSFSGGSVDSIDLDSPVETKDNAGNVTCTSYDALHRPTDVTYSAVSGFATPPEAEFVYDSSTVDSTAMAHAKGRLAEACTVSSHPSSPCGANLVTDLGFGYSVLGQPATLYEATPHSGGYYSIAASYWANGLLDALSGIPGVPTITYSPDSEGRVSAVSASSGQNPVSSVAYSPYASTPNTVVTYGSGDYDTFNFDPDTSRMTQYQ